MYELLVAAAGVVVLALLLWYFKFRKKPVKVYHVGAIKDKVNSSEGQKVLIYGFVKPVYGRVVRLVGQGGSIKARAKFYPREGKVFKGTFRKGVFWIDGVVDEVPNNWKLEWVGV